MESDISKMSDFELLRKIYQSTHDAKIMNSQALQSQLADLISEAEKRGLL